MRGRKSLARDLSAFASLLGDLIFRTGSKPESCAGGLISWAKADQTNCEPTMLAARSAPIRPNLNFVRSVRVVVQIWTCLAGLLKLMPFPSCLTRTKTVTTWGFIIPGNAANQTARIDRNSDRDKQHGFSRGFQLIDRKMDRGAARSRKQLDRNGRTIYNTPACGVAPPEPIRSPGSSVGRAAD